MARKNLTEKVKKQIMMDYIEMQNYTKVAELYGITAPAVHKIVNDNPEYIGLFVKKGIDDTKDILEYMDKRKNQHMNLIDKLLIGMEIKAEDVNRYTNIRDLATAYKSVTETIFKAHELKLQIEADDSINKLETLLSEIKIKAENEDGI